MAPKALNKSIIAFLKENHFLTHAEISKKLKKDKSLVSGYLQAMADYGYISAKKAGNSKTYFLKKIEK